MQEQFPIEEQTDIRIWTGYFSRIYREMVNGHDTGATVFKATATFALVTCTGLNVSIISTLALPFVIVGGTSAVLYGFSAAKDEYDRNREEAEKIARADILERENEQLAKALNQQFKQDINHNCYSINQNQEDIKIDQLDNGALLKLTLRNYLMRLGLLNCTEEDFTAILNRKRKRSGKLPGQEGMISLIESEIKSVTGCSRNHPQFAQRVASFLAAQQIPNLEEDLFADRLKRALELNDQKTTHDNDIHPEPAPTPRSTLRRYGSTFLRWCKDGIFWGIFALARSNTAFGIVMGAGVLFNLVKLGNPLSWPFLAGGLIAATASGIASLVYARYVEKAYAASCKKADERLAKSEQRYKLLYKLNRLRTKQFKNRNEAAPFANALTTEDYDQHFPLLNNHQQSAPVSRRVMARHAIDAAAQMIFGASVGAVIGMAFAGSILLIAAIALPPIFIPFAITLGGVIGLFIVSPRYGYALGKNTYKEGKQEQNKINSVAKQLAECKRKLNNNRLVTSQLNKSQHELVLELMAELIKYNQTLTQTHRRPLPSDLGSTLSKQEKILRLIEKTSGVQRTRNQETGYPQNDDRFFNELSIYLQANTTIRAIANQRVSEFKASVLNLPVDQCKVEQQRTFLSDWNGSVSKAMTAFNRKVFLKHGATVLAMISIAIPLAILLCAATAPWAAPAILMLMVLGAYTVHKVCEYRATQNLEQLADIEAKLPVIEAIEKTKESTTKLAQQEQPVPIPAPVSPPRPPAPVTHPRPEAVTVVPKKVVRYTKQKFFSQRIPKEKQGGTIFPRQSLSDRRANVEEHIKKASGNPTVTKDALSASKERMKLENMDPKLRQSFDILGLWNTPRSQSIKVLSTGDLSNKLAERNPQSGLEAVFDSGSMYFVSSGDNNYK